MATKPLDVLIAGAGVAGLEAALALQALAEGQVSVELLAPEADFVYRPLAGDPPQVTLSAAWRTGDDSPVLAAFLALMR